MSDQLQLKEKSTWWFSTSICQKIMFDKFLRLINHNSSGHKFYLCFTSFFILYCRHWEWPLCHGELEKWKGHQWSPCRWHGECFYIMKEATALLWWFVKQCLLFPTEEPLSDKTLTDLYSLKSARAQECHEYSQLKHLCLDALLDFSGLTAAFRENLCKNRQVLCYFSYIF